MQTEREQEIERIVNEAQGKAKCCPFCGKPSEIQMDDRDARIGCANVECELNPRLIVRFGEDADLEQEMELLLDDWNTRPVEDALQSRATAIIDQMSLEITALKSQIESLTQKRGELQDEVDREYGRNADLEAEVGELKAQVDRLSAPVTDAEIDMHYVATKDGVLLNGLGFNSVIAARKEGK